MLPSTAAISCRAPEHERCSRLCWALFASLLLHLLLGYLLASLPSGGGQRAVQPASPVLATLRGPVAPAGAATDLAAAEASPLPEAPAVAVPPAAVPADAAASSSAGRQVAAAEAVQAVVGERRLLAERPPYLASALSSPPLAETWYVPRRELTLPPMLQGEPLLQPSPGSGPGRAGRVRLRLLIAADGAVDRVEVLGSGVPAAVSDAAVAAFAGLRFRPGEIEGVAVRSEARFEVDFDEAAAGSSHASDRFSLRSDRPRGSATPSPSGSAR